MSEEYNNGGPPLKHIIPFWEKATMTLDEASEYSGIGRNTLYRLTNQNNCPFVLDEILSGKPEGSEQSIKKSKGVNINEVYAENGKIQSTHVKYSKKN